MKDADKINKEQKARKLAKKQVRLKEERRQQAKRAA
jgi:hypothetical protein